MGMLTSEHIDFIVKDLHRRGFVLEGLHEEVVDHMCTAVEAEMANGKRFADAYRDVLRRFGNTAGLRATQQQTLTSQHSNNAIMLKSYITIAWRNLRRQRFYTMINVAGLAVGLAACLIIALYVVDELSYDQYHLNANRIFRVNVEHKFGNNHSSIAACMPPVASTLQRDYPEIESTVRFISYGTYLVNNGKGGESVKENKVVWADSSFFRIFSIPLLEGNPRTALTEPNSIAISRRIAEKYFPEGNAVGQSLLLDNVYNARVTAIYENIPTASHFHFDIIIAMYGNWPVPEEAHSTQFEGNNFNTYLLLKEGADHKTLEAKLTGFTEKYITHGPSKGSDFFKMTLMPVTDIHLRGNMNGELEPNGNITYVYLFEVIALFILIIACINFMNMSTARSESRAREVGVRKVMGSLRSHLVRQFLTESVLVTSCAFVLAVVVAWGCLPLFNELAAKALTIPFRDPVFLAMALVAMLVVGLLAGLYPSFFLSTARPVNVLKGRISTHAGSGTVRSGLVVFQFAVSIFLIVGALTVSRQLAYIQNKDLGFKKEQRLIIKDAYALRPNIQAFKNRISGIGTVQNVTITGFVPIEGPEASRSDRTFWNATEEPRSENLVSLQNWRVDFDYISTMELKIVKGRGFDPAVVSDSSAVVLNESAVQRFGLGADAVGKTINTFSVREGSIDFNSPVSFTVIGVAQDFHFSSMKENIQPLGLFINRSDGFIIAKIDPTNAHATIESIRKVWKELGPGQPFQYSFLDDEFASMYAAEERLGSIFSVFATLAIFIACLGLFALTAFVAEKRKKEIGIRKVLGASADSIVLLLSRDFGKLMLIAFFITAPLAWYAVQWWLEGYSYKADIGVSTYLLAGGLVSAVAVLTMAYQSVRSATTNPIDALRSE
jgi:putative ABC transport system permease protein